MVLSFTLLNIGFEFNPLMPDGNKKNQFIDLKTKSMDWFQYDSDLCHEEVKVGLNADVY